MTQEPNVDAVLDELVREALDDPETGWLSDLSSFRLEYSDFDRAIVLDNRVGSIEVGHLAGIVEDLIERHTKALIARTEAAEQAVARVREVADAWKSRGEHDMEYSATIPQEIGEIIHEGGAEMVNRANLIYRALDGEQS